MRTRFHIATIAVGAALFYGLSSFVATRLPGDLSWYHYPIVFPVQAALWFGKGGEDMNAFAADVTWAAECLVAGLLLDLLVLAVLRLTRRDSPPSG